MTKDEALELSLEALTYIYTETTADEDELIDQAITAIKEALAQPEQKYHRGDRLICLETEEYCVIHISGTDRQWVKFPDSHIGVYTNEQVAELFELLPKDSEQEPVKISHKHEWFRTGEMKVGQIRCISCGTWGQEEIQHRKPLSDEQIEEIAEGYLVDYRIPAGCAWNFARDIEAAHGIKEKNTREEE